MTLLSNDRLARTNDGEYRRPQLGRWSSRARYSLIVTISAPEVEVDLYTPVATQIAVSVEAT